MNKNKAFRYLGVLFGLVFMSVGASFFITANIGSEAITVFIQGIMFKTNSNYAISIIVANLVPVSLLFAIKRNDLLSFGSFAILLIGPLIDFWLASGLFVTPSLIFMQILFLTIGIMLTGFGLSVYIHANVGMSPFEALVVAISQKFKNVRFFIIKILFDMIFLIVGFVLGGVVGIGTVISVLAFGPVINTYLFLLKKIKLFAI
jgi:uncharacterized membrane protein YczE